MAKINRYTYQELSKPLDDVQKTHDDTLKNMEELSKNTDMMKTYLDPQRDAVSYSLLTDFEHNFNKSVDDFARNGLTQTTGMDMLQNRRTWNTKIQPIITAITDKNKEQAEQEKIQFQANGNAIFTKDANEASVDSYLQGNKGYDFVNINDVITRAKASAAAASDRNTSYEYAKEKFSKMYDIAIKTTGYNNEGAWGILKKCAANAKNEFHGQYPNENVDEHFGFINVMEDYLESINIENYSKENQKRIIDSYIKGLDEGLKYKEEYEKYQTQFGANAGRSVTNVRVGGGGGPEVPVDDLITFSDDFMVKSNLDDNSSQQQDWYNNLTGNAGFQSTLRHWFGDFANSMVVSDNGVTRIATLDDFIVNREKEEGYATKNSTSEEVFDKGLASPEEIETYKAEYNDVISKIENVFEMKQDSNGHNSSFKSAIESKDANRINGFLKQCMDDSKSLRKNVNLTLYEIPIKDNSKKNAINSALTRLGRGKNIFSDISINNKTGIYTFGKTVDLYSQIQASQNLDSATIKMVCAPTKENTESPLYAMITVNDVNEGKPFFIPMSAFAHQNIAENTMAIYNSGKATVEQTSALIGYVNEKLGGKASISSKNDVVRLINNTQSIIKKTTDKNTLKELNDLYTKLVQIRNNFDFVDYFNKSWIRQVAGGASQNIQELKIDINRNNDKK